MTEKRTSFFENGLIWFGTAVSISEILTGACFAPLGFSKGLPALLIAHIISRNLAGGINIQAGQAFL